MVVKMPDGSLVIGDGFHRTEKAMKLGHKQIDAYVIDFSLLPPPDIQNSCGHDDTLDLSAEDIALRKRVFDTLDNRAA